VISKEALSVEPYGIMVRKDDAAFKKVANDALNATYKSGEINKIYDKWFNKPIPPRNINLNVPVSASLKKVFSNPTDSGDPAVYK
jgi:glutamate/aspartate transport system substrate-binding protein